jgi:hypothetical protein
MAASESFRPVEHGRLSIQGGCEHGGALPESRFNFDKKQKPRNSTEVESRVFSPAFRRGRCQTIRRSGEQEHQEFA